MSKSDPPFQNEKDEQFFNP
uniref:Uncharacterized protein n=1 Tax=Arundo donax TaxID=35708 RepID=A0A0A9BSR9_ARUDO